MDGQNQNEKVRRETDMSETCINLSYNGTRWVKASAEEFC